MSAFGGIELGGTKVVCAIGLGPGDLAARERFPTTGPDETLERVIGFFRGADEPLTAIGIGAFGPLDLDPDSPGYGAVSSTPKPGWQGTPLLRRVEDGLGLPVAIDTDVAAAAVAEWRWGAARGCRVAVYITVGTGIGAGIVIDGRPFRGLGHSEFGHLPVPRHPADAFGGVCPFHGDCLEGLASGPAILARWGVPGEQLPEDHEAWDLEGRYLGAALAGLVLTIVPERIVLGGGVMDGGRLHQRVRAVTAGHLAGYLQHVPLMGTLDGYIVPPALGVDAGVLGAIALARSLVDDT